MRYFVILTLILVNFSCSEQKPGNGEGKSKSDQVLLKIIQNEGEGTISITRSNEDQPILIQNAKTDTRPYIHPIAAPDGNGVLTEYQPAHHRHQTGLYWGLKMVNERDFFMNWQGDYWQKVSSSVVQETGTRVKWQTIYDMLDENGDVVLRETQDWSMQESNGKYILDLFWKGEAKTDIIFGEFYVGGLFLRMPWYEGIAGEVINAAGQRNQEAEQQRAIWTDIGLQVEGRDDLAHIALFDHPENSSFPIPWRVDGELGVGPSRQILGDWQLQNGETETVRYRLVVYTGSLNKEEITRQWKEFACEF